jgi:hypothetical protein
MALKISKAVLEKIGQDDHGNQTEATVKQACANFPGRAAYDIRPQHQAKSGAPTIWFIAPTNDGTKLKITFVAEDGDAHLKSAYPATSPALLREWRRYAGEVTEDCPAYFAEPAV